MKQRDIAREWLDAKKRADLHLLILSGGLCALGLKKKMGFTQKRSTCKEELGRNNRWKHGWMLTFFLERSIFQMTAVGGSSAVDKAQAVLKTRASIRERAGCSRLNLILMSRGMKQWDQYAAGEWKQVKGSFSQCRTCAISIHCVAVKPKSLHLSFYSGEERRAFYCIDARHKTRPHICCRRDTLSAFRVQIKCQIFSCFRESRENMYLRLPSLPTIRAAAVECLRRL